MNKFSFWLWSINGILIFGLLTTLIYNRPAWLFEKQETETNTTNPYYYEMPIGWGSVVVDKNKLDKQYAEYENVPIITGTQANAGYTLASIVNVDTKTLNQNNYQYFSTAALSNVVFSDATGKSYHKLLDKPAFIHFLDLSAGSLYDNVTGNYIVADPNYILYKISFEDTNNDGLLNDMDMADLYISDTDGKNLKKLNPPNSVCISYDFLDQEHKNIRISFFEKSVDNKINKGAQKFINYSVVNKTFDVLTEMNNILNTVK